MGFLFSQKRTNGSILGGRERKPTLWEEKGNVKACVDEESTTVCVPFFP
jgi:hypothetical protein